MQQYNYSKLLGRMKERGYTQEAFAKMLGISACSLNSSLNNKRDFKQDEMLKACEVLGIPTSQLPVFFYTHKL